MEMEAERKVVKALLDALASGVTLEEIRHQLPEYDKRVLAILRLLFSHLEDKRNELTEVQRKEIEWVQSPLDIPEAARRLIEIRREKDQAVKSQRFEEGARLRDLGKAYSDTFGEAYGQAKQYSAGLRWFEEGVRSIDSSDEAFERLMAALDAAAAEDQGDGPISFVVDPGSATPEEVGELLAEISSLYRMIGGSGITFKETGVREAEVA